MNIPQLIFNGPQDKLTLTENTQPAILTMSVAVCRLLDQRGVKPSYPSPRPENSAPARPVADP